MSFKKASAVSVATTIYEEDARMVVLIPE